LHHESDPSHWFAGGNDGRLRLAAAQDEARKKDARLAPPRHYDLKYFPWTPPETKDAWEARKQIVREARARRQRPLAHAGEDAAQAGHPRQIERDGYTIEKVSSPATPGTM